MICDDLPYLEKLKTSRDALLSDYLMDNYGITQLLEILNNTHQKEGIEDYPSVQVMGWRAVTTRTTAQ